MANFCKNCGKPLQGDEKCSCCQGQQRDIYQENDNQQSSNAYYQNIQENMVNEPPRYQQMNMNGCNPNYYNQQQMYNPKKEGGA